MIEGDARGVKCPVCAGKLDFDVKLKLLKCHNCGWVKIEEERD